MLFNKLNPTLIIPTLYAKKMNFVDFETRTCTNSGWRWPNVGDDITFKTSGDKLDGPGPESNFSGILIDPKRASVGARNFGNETMLK